MRRPILLVSSLVSVLCAAAGAQTTVTVNRLGGANFRTISDAIAATAPGDTIRFQGMVDANGPFAYDNDASDPSLPPESFPLQPLGRSVQADPSTPPVYIWDVTGSTGVTLVEVSPQPGNPTQTALRGLRLVGGDTGVSVDLGSSMDSSVLLDRVAFARNRTGLKVVGLEGGSIGFDGQSTLVLSDCKITFAFPTPSLTHPPSLRDQYRGIDLDAESIQKEKDSSRILIRVINLQTVGSFPQIDPDATLIRLFAKGTTARSEHRNGLQNPAPIPHVIVLIEGGDLNGFANPLGGALDGWSVGIDASVDKDGSALDPYSYAAAFEVRGTGTRLRNFRDQGMRGITVSKYTRGHFVLSGGTEVTEIGVQAGVPPNDFAHRSGVYMDCNEGYLTLHTRNSVISRNAGNGIGLHVNALTMQDTQVPWGMFVDIASSEIHENGQDGIHMWADPQSIVGGTWSYDPVTGARRILSGPDVDIITSDDLLNGTGVAKGQGRIDACAISNNGTPGTYEGHGIRMTLANGASSPASECIGACRMTNNIIWNHSAEGILFELPNVAPAPCTLISPVLHCTLAGNGGASNGMGGVARTIEVTHPDKVTFNWEEPGTQQKLNTKFYDSIFLGRTVGDQVFGDAVAASYVLVDPYGNPASSSGLVYCRGLRTSQALGDDYGEVDWNVPGKQGWWTVDPPPFAVWPPNYASTDPTQFSLTSGTGDGFEETPFFMGPFIPPAEILQDFQPILRPPLLEPGSNPPTSLRDKGAFQR